jgi:uncharacterized protein (TIGR02001 family)
MKYAAKKVLNSTIRARVGVSFSHHKGRCMQKVSVLAALGLLSAAGAANAEVSATVTATNDYIFRGITQSAEDPALQASVDYADESGWYIGAWGSNVDFGPDDPTDGLEDVGIEVDLYTGFSGGSEDGLGWDVGLVYYAYPEESEFNYPEIYGKISHGIFSGGLFYSNDWVNSGEDSMYVNAGVSVPFADAFSFNAGAGYSFGDAFDDTEYVDYSIGVGYTLSNFEMSLSWIDTDLDEGEDLFSDGEVFNTEGRVVFTIATTFPWSAD